MTGIQASEARKPGGASPFGDTAAEDGARPATRVDGVPGAGGDAGSGLLAGGGLIGALAASSCCVVPLVLFALGATGPWIGNLTAMAPYQPIFLVLSTALIAGGFARIYRQPRGTERSVHSACARPTTARVVKLALWLAVLLVAAALAFPYVAPALY